MGADRSVEERQSERMSPPDQRLLMPAPGDVLASQPTARADLYFISVVPDAAHLTARRHPEAVDTVRDLARQRSVDGWLTYNRTHYARIARNRA